MKSGSLVECINNKLFEDKVKLNTPYTVKEVFPKGTIIRAEHPRIVCPVDGISLEEVDGTYCMPQFNLNVPDVPFPMENFRELLPNVKGFVEELFELIELVPA